MIHKPLYNKASFPGGGGCIWGNEPPSWKGVSNSLSSHLRKKKPGKRKAPIESPISFLGANC